MFLVSSYEQKDLRYNYTGGLVNIYVYGMSLDGYSFYYSTTKGSAHTLEENAA
jgi:hypothetical protein